MPNRLPLRVFVASSSEQSPTARRLAELLRAEPDFHVDLWNQGVFTFSATYIESLEAELDRADFGIFVMTGDDRATVRGRRVTLPRDNLNFELGLFTGRLGRSRCIFFVDRGAHTKIASDLEGVEAAAFVRAASGGAREGPALAVQLRKAMRQMRELGARYKPTSEAREAQRMLRNFSSEVAGCWWERMRSGEDDKSAMSYVSMGVDEVTNAPTMEGWAYDLAGAPLADWRSLSTGVLLGARPRVFYRWQGQHENEAGQVYGGGGHVDLDASLQHGDGHFYDTNFARVTRAASSTRVKRFRMYRASAREMEIMHDPWSAEASALVRQKLKAMRWRR